MTEVQYLALQAIKPELDKLQNRIEKLEEIVAELVNKSQSVVNLDYNSDSILGVVVSNNKRY